MLSKVDSAVYVPETVLGQVNGIVSDYLNEKYSKGSEYPFPSRDVSLVAERVRERLLADNGISPEQRAEAERIAGLNVCDWHMRRSSRYNSSNPIVRR